MEKKSLSRWQASGLHLLISIAIAAGVVTLMLSRWYPGPLFEAAGGNDLLVILIGVDVAIGPLITLVIFRAGKRGLKFDLAVIGALQLGALLYGVHAVYLARPAFIVFVRDQFQVASVAQLDPEELAKAKYPEFREPPLDGPRFAFAVAPTDPMEIRQFALFGLAGHDLQEFPRLFVPYGERAAEVLKKAAPLALVRRREPAAAKVVDAWLAESGTREADVRYVRMRARRAWMAVLIDASTAQPVKTLITERVR
jgi:hypothetical protein